jgi:hypothetical protein
MAAATVENLSIVVNGRTIIRVHIVGGHVAGWPRLTLGK